MRKYRVIASPINFKFGFETRKANLCLFNLLKL